jgi:hypothetical protein
MGAENARDWVTFTAAKRRVMDRLAAQSEVHRLTEIWLLPARAGDPGDVDDAPDPDDGHTPHS